MGRLESPGNRGGYQGGASRRQRAMASEQGAEVVAVNVLGHDVSSRGIGAEVVDGHDVGVAEPGRGPYGLAELRDEVGVATVLGAKQLDGDVPIELDVAGPVDGGDVAFAEQLHEPVAAPDHPSDLGQVRTSRVRPGRPGVLAEV